MGNFLPKHDNNGHLPDRSQKLFPFISILYLSQRPCPDVGVKTMQGGARPRPLPSGAQPFRGRASPIERTTAPDYQCQGSRAQQWKDGP